MTQRRETWSRRLGLAPGSELERNEAGEQIVVRRAGRFTSKDVHRASFPKAPKARTLDELKEGLKRHARIRHANR